MANWLITGCSSGLGHALAREALTRGDTVVATARDPASLADLVADFTDRVLPVALDVTDAAAIARAVDAAQARFGAIDMLVNNAGYGYRAAVEEGDASDVEHLFATNLFGPIELIKAVLPAMRARRSGGIVNISSIAAARTAPGSGYYAAGKCALESMSDGLRKEVAPLGIKVMVVEPGAFRTAFAGRSLTQSATVIEDYASTAGLRRKEHDDSDGQQPGDPARAAARIIDTIESAEPPFRLALGRDAVDLIRFELKARLRELSDWERVSVTTDFND